MNATAKTTKTIVQLSPMNAPIYLGYFIIQSINFILKIRKSKPKLA